MNDPKRLKTIQTKVVGVTFPNPDGSSRQTAIKRCREGEDLKLVWEVNNVHDPNAIAVHRGTMTGPQEKQLGYLSRDVAPMVVRAIKKKCLLSCELKHKTGGGWFTGKNWGANIEIGIYEAPQED